MSIAKRLRAFAILYEAYAPHLSEEAAYQIEREAALIEQQRRLQCPAQWLAAHPEGA